MKIEGLCAKTYHYFGEIYRENPDVARLWKKTALEEENHQKQFKLALRLFDEVDFDITPADMDRAAVVHKKVSAYLRSVKRTPPDLVRAFTEVIEIEEIAADLHAQTALHYKDDSVQKLFIALGSSDREHIELLRNYREQLNTSG